MVWISRIQKNNSLVYRHALRLAILCCLVGRQFGLNRFLLIDLTMSMLLTGIGKSMIKMTTLQQYRFDFTPSDYIDHIKYTLEKIGGCDIPGLDSIDIVANYCERIDGSGYPHGKKGNEIPLLAQIAGLIEYFEIQVNPFDLAQAKSPSEAITQINMVKNVLFHDALVEKFVHAIGIYPTGTLVELNDDRIGIVCSQSYEKRLRASVIPLTNRRGEIVGSFKIVDLSLPSQWQLSDSKIRIRKGLPIDTLPARVIADAHAWLFDKNFGTWSKVKNLMHDVSR
jgi:HD-GYP domain-containing protein (c-di-GMP phosphodiesterase class II)